MSTRNPLPARGAAPNPVPPVAADFSKPVQPAQKSAFNYSAKSSITAAPAICSSPSRISATPSAIFAASPSIDSIPKQRRSVTLKEAQRCHRHRGQKSHRLSAIRRRRTAGAQRPARHDPLRRRARHSSDGLHQRLALDRAEHARPGRATA